MRIALLQEERYLPTWHGSNKSCRLLLEGLARAGHDCLALCPVRRAETSLAELRADLQARGVALGEPAPGVLAYEHRGVRVRGLPRETEARPAALREALGAFEPDVVLVSGDPRAYLLEAALAAAPERVVFMVHSHEHVPFGPLRLRRDEAQAERIRRARAVLAWSRYSQGYLAEHGGIAARFIPYPAYGDGPFPRLGRFDCGDVLLVNAHETKGGELFLALARSLPGRSFAVLRWAASARLLAELGRCPNVRLLEPVDDIEDALRGTRVLLMPSLLPETFGIVAVEALLRGIPVVAADAGGLREATCGAARLLPVEQAVPEGGDYRCPVQDPGPWAQALLELDRREVYEERAALGRGAAGRFVSELSVRPFEELFREVSGAPPREPVAVVDPFDAAFLLCQELARRGHPVVGVESSADVAPLLRAQCDRTQLAAVVRHGSDPAATAAELRRLGVRRVLPGCEPGVPVADRLAAELGSRGNDPTTSLFRRDKSLMAEAARAAGLRVPAQCCSADWDELRAFALRHGRWPVVAKPPANLASEDVHVCRSEAELRRAYERILRRRNLAGLDNRAVLVQELLDGTQYVVDTLSRDGEHFLSAVWRYGRPAFAGALLRWARGAGGWPEELGGLGWDEIQYASVGNDSKLTVPGDDARARTLFGYAAGVLDAIGVRQGPAHFELMWVDEEPFLVEVGARLHGAPNTHWMCRITTGASQLDQTIDLYLDPRRFELGARREVPLAWHGANVRLHPWRAGRLRGFRGLERIERLPSFRRFFYLPEPGPVELHACVGVACLIHADEEVVLADFAAIRALERQDLFDLEPAGALAAP